MKFIPIIQGKYITYLVPTQSMYGINSLKFLCPNLWNNTWKNGVASNENDVVKFENVCTIYQFKRVLKNIIFTVIL